MTRSTSLRWLHLALLVAASTLFGLAQRGNRVPTVITPPAPQWKLDEHFQRDAFSFVRVKYTVDGTYGMGSSGNMRWAIDYPDCELNFSYRLNQMTSMKVDPEGKILELTDKALYDYPWIYIIEPGRLTFKEEEIKILREYLLNGGFLMCDDFWGDDEYNNFARELRKVFPDREPQELPLDHPIFHGIFDMKEKPQVPGVAWADRAQQTGQTWEARDPSHEKVHYKAIFDDRGRIMVILCHNTDLGDGWEREGESEYYFREFSEKKAYPMGINIVFYSMTH